jgi:hypothetical protein
LPRGHLFGPDQHKHGDIFGMHKPLWMWNNCFGKEKLQKIKFTVYIRIFNVNIVCDLADFV